MRDLLNTTIGEILLFIGWGYSIWLGFEYVEYLLKRYFGIWYTRDEWLNNWFLVILSIVIVVIISLAYVYFFGILVPKFLG